VPIIAFLQSGGFYRWAVSVYNTVSDYDTIASIKFSPNGKYVVASPVNANFQLAITLIVFNAINGTVYQTLKKANNQYPSR
jgi:hypothetical protein